MSLMIGTTLILTPHVSYAQRACQAQKLIGSQVTQADVFGSPLAISGDTLVIGAWRDDDNGDNSGAAYVFRFDATVKRWVEEQKLVPLDGAAFDRFGNGLAIDGDTIIIGAPYDDHEDCANPPLCDSGSAYVFRFDPDSSRWHQEQKLVPNDSEEMDLFGARIGLNGSCAIIGASFDDDNGSDSGSAYVFRYNGERWMQEQKLLPEDGAAGDRFGLDVSMSDGVAAIGAWQDDDNGVDSGSVSIYRFSVGRWVEEQKLLASDGAPADYFGRTVSIDGDAILIGVRYDDDMGLDSGSAYVYRYDGERWFEEQKLVPLDGAQLDWFGDSVALSGDVAVIGSVNDDDQGNSSGSVYVYRFAAQRWIESQKLLASDGHSAHWFGGTVEVAGDTAVIGASGDFDQGIQAGAAYVFVGVSGIDCNANGISDACDILAGNETDGNGDGVPDACVCPWDLDSSGDVGIVDFLALLAVWGTNPGGPPDFDGDGNVGILDFLALLTNWGACA